MIKYEIIFLRSNILKSNRNNELSGAPDFGSHDEPPEEPNLSMGGNHFYYFNFQQVDIVQFLLWERSWTWNSEMDMKIRLQFY